MNHSQYVSNLQGPIGIHLVKELCKCSPTIRCRYHNTCVRYWCLKEFVVRFDKGLINPDGKYKQCHRFFDAVLFVEPTINALAQKWTFRVGVEVNCTEHDLAKDNKIPYYLGWTDFFFLAVPAELVPQALKKAKSDSRIGVMSLTSGKILNMPSWQDIPTGRKYELMLQAFFGYMNKDVPVNQFVLQ